MFEIIKGAFNDKEMSQVATSVEVIFLKKLSTAYQTPLDPKTGFYMSEERRLGFE